MLNDQNSYTYENIAILYSPGTSKNTTNALLQKLNHLIEQFNIVNAKVEINPNLPLGPNEISMNQNKLITVIIGWGLHEKPQWANWMKEFETLTNVRQFIGIDLFERYNIHGKPFNVPRLIAGRYWSKKLKQNNINLFLEGYYLKGFVPYGMKNIQSNEKRWFVKNPGNLYTLKSGKKEELEIVRLIFYLFVNCDYNLTEITNLLIAQNIDPPRRKHTWNTAIIKTILKTHEYIGSNIYNGCVKQDVFDQIIEKSLFYEAQAKLSLRSNVPKIPKPFYPDK
jgi:hypothetical protein